jgi:hypothetical protein
MIGAMIGNKTVSDLKNAIWGYYKSAYNKSFIRK